MALHRRKRRLRLGPPEILLIVLTLAGVAFLISGALAAPGDGWEEAPGEVVLVERIQKASVSPGSEYRLRVHYTFSDGARKIDGRWEGEWPESHSPNALPRDRWTELRQPGHPLTVYYDPEHPEKNSPHLTGGAYPLWWFRLSVGLCLVLLWFALVFYPRWKATR